MRSIFGWDLPPGCTQRHIDEAFGVEEPCEVCGYFPDDCVCPDCPVCGEPGRLACYGAGKDDHIKHLTKAQVIGVTKRKIDELQEQIGDHQQYLAIIEEHPDEWTEEL